MKTEFEIKPLGGLGQIGSNCCLFEDENESILVDCGILFPYENCFDLNYLIPDFNTLPENLSNVVITHGHEDHIGAIIHLVKKFPNITIYAPPFAAKLIEEKLSYRKLNANTILFGNFQTLSFENFEITPFEVDHSIPHTFGLKIYHNKSDFNVIYISDFKVHTKGITRSLNSLNKLKKELNPDRTLFMADSTNIMSNTLKTSQEEDLIPRLKDIFSRPFKRIFVTTFASNVDRLDTIIQSALETGWTSFSCQGRSVKNYLRIATELDLLKNKIKITDIDEINFRAKPLIFVSGCQGDFKSALRRIAMGTDGKFKPQKGDLFLFSSKPIPGNEKILSIIYNELVNRGAEVITTLDYPDIHTSGHPGRDDLKQAYKILNPKYAIPIHGESYFLKRHFDFIKATFPTIIPISLHNGDNLKISNGEKLSLVTSDEMDKILIHGKDHEIDSDSLRERRKLATTGLLMLTISSSKGAVLDLRTLGIPLSLVDRDRIDKLTKTLINSAGKGFKGDNLNEEIRIAVRRVIFETTGYKPVVEIISV